MAKMMFQITGAADSGEVSGILTQPDDSTVEVKVDSPVELESSGSYRLQLEITGFVSISLNFAVDTEAGPPKMRPKDGLLPLAVTLVRQRFLDETADEQSDVLFLLRCDFGYPREMVLVSGAYCRDLGADFDRFAKTHRDDQLHEDTKSLDSVADTNTQVSQFDFKTGKRLTYMLRSPTRWMVIDEEDFGVPTVSAQSPEGLSITDVYNWIIGAGESLAGRVVEFSFFSHASQGGPVLVNGQDESDGDERDPNDHDPRIKDFNGKNTDVSAFANAFADNAHSRIFGGFPSGIHKCCARVIANPKPDDADSTFRITPSSGAALNLTWNQCEEALQRGLNRNYAAHLATATGLPVWAGSPGAEATYAHEGLREYMEMDSRNFGPYIETVCDALDLEQDARGYVKYDGASGDSGSTEATGDEEAAPVGTAQSATSAQGSESEPEAEPESEDETEEEETVTLSLLEPIKNREQYVNLEEDAGETHYGRDVCVQVQVDPPKAGVTIHWSFEGDSEYASELARAQKAGFGDNQTATMTSQTDEDGVACAGFTLSTCGGDEFRITAGRSSGDAEVTTGTVTVWRKLWYEVDTMKKMPSLGGHFLMEGEEDIKNEFARVFVEVERSGVDNHPENQRALSRAEVSSGFGAEYFGAEKAPYQAHLTMVDHYADAVPDILYYCRIESLIHQTEDAFKDLYVYGEGKSWLTDIAIITQNLTEPGTPLPHSMVDITGVDGDAGRHIRIDFTGYSTVPSPESPVAVRLTLVACEDKLGAAWRHHSYVAGGYLAERYDGPTRASLVMSSIVHELAHNFGMVSDDSASFVNTSNKPGGRQRHCSEPGCLMASRPSDDDTFHFCEHCLKAFRKIDMAKCTDKFAATRGAKA